MITKCDNKGTFYSKLVHPNYKGLLEKIIELYFNAQKTSSTTLTFKIDAWLVYFDFPSHAKKFEVLKSQTTYELKIEGGTTALELFEIVKDAVDCLKACGNLSESDKKEYLSGIPYPPFERNENQLNEIAAAF